MMEMITEPDKKIRCKQCHSILVEVKIDIFGAMRTRCWNDQCKEDSHYTGSEVTIKTSGISKSESKMCYFGCVCEVCWPELKEM